MIYLQSAALYQYLNLFFQTWDSASPKQYKGRYLRLGLVSAV